MLSGKCFATFYVFSFPLGVYVGTLNLIASILGPFIFTLFTERKVYLSKRVDYFQEVVCGLPKPTINTKRRYKLQKIKAKQLTDSKLIENRNITVAQSFTFTHKYRNVCLGGSTRFPVAGQSFYDGFSINYPLQQDKTLIALHIYS